MRGRKSRFSTPMPCSPVIEPPRLTQRSRISPASASARSTRAALAAVEEDQRVQVAVAGVEDVGDAQAGAGGQPPDLLERLAQPRARDAAVLHQVVGRQPADGRERALAALPDQRPLGGVLGGADLGGPRGADHLAQPRHVLVDAGALAVELHDQEGAEPCGYPGLTEDSAAWIASSSMISIATGAARPPPRRRRRRRRCAGPGRRPAPCALASGTGSSRSVVLERDLRAGPPSRRSRQTQSGPTRSFLLDAEHHDLAVGQDGLDGRARGPRYP